MIGKTISHYRIDEKLGGGGMGACCRTENSPLPRSLIVKHGAYARLKWTVVISFQRSSLEARTVLCEVSGIF